MGVVVVVRTPAGRAQLGWILGIGQRPPQVIYGEQVGCLFDKDVIRFFVVAERAVQQHIRVFLEVSFDVRAAINLPEIHGSGVAVDVEAVPVFDVSVVCLHRLESR